MQSQQQKGGMMIPADRSARSIFVGNISYDVTEDELKKIFSACGQIIGFRLMYDRDTGRPKGFGFCEFTDVQQAEAAIRNFNGYELHGRQLRVDSATGNESEQQQIQQQQIPINPPQPVLPIPDENPYGPEPEPGKAPEAIARTVASMPPEKMFELMKSMKETVNNNPQMARQLLIENPQLSYALLQAQVVMRVVDPKVAYSMLHREAAQPLSASSVAATLHQQPPQGFQGQGQQQFQPQNISSQFNMPPPMTASGQQQFHSFPPSNNMGMPPPVMQQAIGGFQVKQQQAAQITANQQMQQQQIQQHPQQSPQQQIPPQQQAQDNLDEEQQAQMLVRVLQLTDEQIRMLPPTERAQVIELRNQLRSAGASA